MADRNRLSDAELDHYQKIARSSYADMLHDDERNRAYSEAIQLCVRVIVKSPHINPDGRKFFHCCDIGTGSGLLSMMIVRAFHLEDYYDFHVTAFEEAKHMAECAEKVIQTNCMSEFITVLPHNSTRQDSDPRFDLLVAELLDTELIGEGCLLAYRHAIEKLCAPSCLFVPYKARIFIEPVASKLLFDRHALNTVNYIIDESNSLNLKFRWEEITCNGSEELDDMQVGSLRESIDFHRVCEPQVAFTFTFAKINTLVKRDKKELTFEISKDVKEPIVVVMWWDIEMYDSVRVDDWYTAYNSDALNLLTMGSRYLSCAPLWARDHEMKTRDALYRATYDRDVWREHWIQAIYYFSDVSMVRDMVGTLKQGDKLTLYANHDYYSLWFELRNSRPKNDRGCKCGAHRHLNREQIAFLNDDLMMFKFIKAAFFGVTGPGSERHYDARLVFRTVNRNPRTNSFWRINIDDSSSLYFLDPDLNREISWSTVLNKMLQDQCTHPITELRIMFTQVRFDNLHRICTPVVSCESFVMNDLDEMIQNASRIADDPIESHRLWEYGCTRLDEDYLLLEGNSDDLVFRADTILSGRYKKSYKLPISRVKGDWISSWALVFWCELRLSDDRQWLSTGPVDFKDPLEPDKTRKGDPMTWARNFRQQVCFLHNLKDLVKGKRELAIDISLLKEKIRIEFPDQVARGRSRVASPVTPHRRNPPQP